MTETPVSNLLSRSEKKIRLFFLSAACLMLGCLGVFSTPFFRDYSIIFEGGYRVMLGQVPYRDFYIPVGPVTFYIQGFFDFLLGANLWASGFHSGSLAAVLAVCLYLVSWPRLGKNAAVFFSLLSFFSLTGVINYPWYNTESYFFFLLNIFLLIKIQDLPRLEKKTCIFSALLTFLGIFSKQDTGMLHFFAVTGFFLFYFRQDFKLWLLNYAGLTVLLTILTVIGYQSVGNFLYWFNYGQPPHSSKFHEFFDAKPWTHWRFYALIVLGICQFLPKLSLEVRKRAFLLAVLTGLPFVTAYTSGRPMQTWLYGSIAGLFVFYDLLLYIPVPPQKFPRYKSILRALIIAAGIFWVDAFGLMGRYVTGTVLMQPRFESASWAQDLKQRFGLSEMTVIQEGSYKHGLIPKENIDDLQKLKNTIREYDGNFFNMSEYEFLYTDFKVRPPAGVPLWFDQGTSYFDRDISNLKEYIAAKKPGLILLQDPHTNDWRPLKIHLFYYFIDVGYHKLYHMSAPAAYRIDILALNS